MFVIALKQSFYSILGAGVSSFGQAAMIEVYVNGTRIVPYGILRNARFIILLTKLIARIASSYRDGK